MSGTFSLQHTVTGSTNNDASWSFPFNQLNPSVPTVYDDVQYSISASIVTQRKYYWAKLQLTCWDGDEAFDLTYSNSPTPVRVTRQALWYDRGTNSVTMVISN